MHSHERLLVNRCFAITIMMAARWVGQNSGPIFRRLWTEVYRIKLPVRGCPQFAMPFSD